MILTDVTAFGFKYNFEQYVIKYTKCDPLANFNGICGECIAGDRYCSGSDELCSAVATDLCSIRGNEANGSLYQFQFVKKV